MSKINIKFLQFENIRNINARFGKGSIERTLGVKIALFLLKLYLIAMFILMVVKFVRILSGGGI